MPEIDIFYIFIFTIGTIIGSFLNVVIDRLPFGKSILYPPSHCPHCRHKLAIYDLVPILSFLYLKGRCRYCRAKISRYYPLIEIVTGVLFVLTTFFVTEIGLLIYLFAIISILIVVFFIDLKYGIIPFRIILFGLSIITVRYLFFSFSDYAYILNYAIPGIYVFLLFFLLFFVTRGKAIGFGDVFFSLFMGYLLGFPKILVAVYIAFLTGAFVSLILILRGKKKLKGGTVPFGPFLVFGTIIGLFWGNYIINMALKFLQSY